MTSTTRRASEASELQNPEVRKFRTLLKAVFDTFLFSCNG